VNPKTRRRTAALLEVFGVYLTGAFLADQIAGLLVRWGASPQNPFDLLTTHATDADLLLASRLLLFRLVVQYGSYLALIIPINWWYRRRGPAAYGLTRAGLPWKALIAAALAAAALTQWPVLVHTLVDAVHPLGRMAPWRQAFFEMSWRRWQFWLFAAIMSYALVPLGEELIFRGYYQRRLAEDWGDGPAIIGTACFFTFAHNQYLIPNPYNLTMIVSLFCLAIGLGIVFARTRSLIPPIVAHAMINVPMTAVWQGMLLIVFAIGALFAWRSGLKAVREVFHNTRAAACAALAVLLTAYVIWAGRMGNMSYLAVGILLAAVVLEAIDRRANRSNSVSSISCDQEA
jgi:membrane protease YdiL (CAAX protease family)